MHSCHSNALGKLNYCLAFRGTRLHKLCRNLGIPIDDHSVCMDDRHTYLTRKGMVAPFAKVRYPKLRTAIKRCMEC